MKLPVGLLLAAVALGVVSCGGTTTAPPSTTDNTMKPAGPKAAVVAEGGGKTVVSDNARLEGDPPPADAQYTIFCDAIRGPNHVMTSTAIKDRLMQEKGLRNWHILHSNDQSAIYYGYYRTCDDRNNDPQEFARAQSDLKNIKGLVNIQKDPLFKNPIFLPISNPDPDAPPQWNLVNTPGTAFWSLQIAAFTGYPDRKKDALDVVRKAREAGVEAYYFHGETVSSVCIGAWPEEAVKRQDSADAHIADSRGTFVYVNGTLPPNVSPNMKDRDGNQVTIIAPKLEVLDPSMAAAIRTYPSHCVNFKDRERKAGNGEMIRDPSFLVLVPHTNGALPPIAPLPQAKLDANSGAADAANSILDDSHPTPPQAAKLRSIDNP